MKCMGISKFVLDLFTNVSPLSFSSGIQLFKGEKFATTYKCSSVLGCVITVLFALSLLIALFAKFVTIGKINQRYSFNDKAVEFGTALNIDLNDPHQFPLQFYISWDNKPGHSTSNYDLC